MQKLDKKNKYADNPRQITEKQFRLLDEHLNEFGDLSGVVYCTKQKALVGGNMRSEIMDGAEIEITERFDKPTKNKTLAHGFIKFNGEKFAYREVSFNKSEFKKACVVANNDGGSFDWQILSSSEWDALPLADWGLDVPKAGYDLLPDDDASEKDEAPSSAEKYPLAIILNRDQKNKWELFKQENSFATDTKAFEFIWESLNQKK